MSVEKGEAAARQKTKETFKKGNTPQDVMKSYDEWSENFEELIRKGWYNAPVIALEEVLRRIPPESRATTHLLDVGAGTGWLGPKLYEAGFRLIDGLEPSKGMLDKLKEKGVYNKALLEFITPKPSSIAAGTYDLLISSGGWGEGHIPVRGLDEFLRITKKGGMIIIVMLIDFMKNTEDYKDKLQPYMEELEKKGAWTKIEQRVVPNYYFDKEGLVHVYRVP